MSNVIPFPQKLRVKNYFGGCPHCGEATEFFNIYKSQWCYCEKHRTKWYFGTNLFSSWREENEEIWKYNYFKFAPYHTVEPLPCNIDVRVPV